MKILCIDDTLRPDEIPIEKWVSIAVESPGGGEIPPFDSIHQAMGWCERREHLV